MQKRILSASICDGKGKPCVALSFHCGINILSGQETEEILPALAHIFGGRPCRIVQAVM